MVARSLPPAPPNTKRKALAAAEKQLMSMLFDSGAVVPGTWYRRGQDLISVVQYGIDTKPHAEQAYLRLKDARLDGDYVRRVVQAETKLSRQRFQAALNPKIHTHLNILAWALPMGVSAAAVPGRQVQETYVILLNDAQMNDGSIVLEMRTMGMHLNDAARQKLAAKQKLIDDSIRLTGKNGFSGAWFEKSFGDGMDRVVITAFKADPTTTASAAEPYLKLQPLDSLTFEDSREGLKASFDPGELLRGSSAFLSIAGPKAEASKSLILANHDELALKKIEGQHAVASLAIRKSSSNPVLGQQQFQVVYEQPVLLPAGARTRSFFLAFLSLAAVVALAVWGYYHAMLARHFRLWLPGYVTSFELPPVSQRIASRHIVRLPTETGELAAVLTLPSPLIRAIFYRQATLRWDPKLRLLKAPATLEIKDLMHLPTVTKLVWHDRPPTAGEFELTIERPAKNGRNQRAKINVRFLSLPNRPRTSIENL